jgi:hypothetical protein
MSDFNKMRASLFRKDTRLGPEAQALVDGVDRTLEQLIDAVERLEKADALAQATPAPRLGRNGESSPSIDALLSLPKAERQKIIAKLSN